MCGVLSIPTRLVVADFACSQPYPQDMPSHSLRRSSSPQKNVAYALDFLRFTPCGEAEGWDSLLMLKKKALILSDACDSAPIFPIREKFH